MISSGLISSSVKPQLTVDEVEKVQRKRVASTIGLECQLTYSAVFELLIHVEKVNCCDGCAIHHPSQREHSFLMMYNEDAWMYYRDEVREKIDTNIVRKTSESVYSTLGFKLSNSWERAYGDQPAKVPSDQYVSHDTGNRILW